jgi:hypothetical protein
MPLLESGNISLTTTSSNASAVRVDAEMVAAIRRMQNRIGNIRLEWAPRDKNKEKHMSKQVNNIDDINLAEGEVIIVRQADGGDEVRWTSDGRGSFTNDGASLEAEAFESAIFNGNVFFDTPHHVGEVLSDGTFYYKIMGKDGDDWVIAKTDSRGAARHTSIRVGPVPVNLYPQPTGENQYTLPAFNMAYEVHRSRLVAQRLDEILAAGEVPPEVAYQVKVKVRGTTQVRPTQAQAKRMVGAGVKVARVGPTEVTYDKEITVAKTSRWGCACDQVTEADLDQATDQIETWSVTGCEAVPA